MEVSLKVATQLLDGLEKRCVEEEEVMNKNDVALFFKTSPEQGARIIREVNEKINSELRLRGKALKSNIIKCYKEEKND